MSLSLECKKAKRTGFIPAFLCGGILAAAVPIVNMAVRSEMYVGQQSSPMQILMGANWQAKDEKVRELCISYLSNMLNLGFSKKEATDFLIEYSSKLKEPNK